MRNKFETQLEELNRELIHMGALVEESIDSAVKALCNQDKEEARKAIAFDRKIDYKEKEIEDLCLKLILQQQPVASDLRQISAALKMITDMERIGDQAEDIAEIIGFLNGRTGADCAYIGDMAEATSDPNEPLPRHVKVTRGRSPRADGD